MNIQFQKSMQTCEPIQNVEHVTNLQITVYCYKNLLYVDTIQYRWSLSLLKIHYNTLSPIIEPSI
jgi:hypothetical protein